MRLVDALMLSHRLLDGPTVLGSPAFPMRFAVVADNPPWHVRASECTGSTCGQPTSTTVCLLSIDFRLPRSETADDWGHLRPSMLGIKAGWIGPSLSNKLVWREP